MNKIKIYTDGGCDNNRIRKNIGAWSFILLTDNNKIINSGSEQNTTNNRMEMIAFLKALQYINENLKIYKSTEFILYSDSKYLIQSLRYWIKNWIKSNWKRYDKKQKKMVEVKNVDLWKIILKNLGDKDFYYFKVHAHSGNKHNEQCDELCRQAIIKRRRNIGIKYNLEE